MTGYQALCKVIKENRGKPLPLSKLNELVRKEQQDSQVQQSRKSLCRSQGTAAEGS